MRWQRLLPILIGITTAVIAVLIGNAVYAFVVEDPCAYHNGVVETSWLFDLYFPMTSTNGFHPEPGLVFYLTTLAAGIGLGVLSFRMLKRRRKDPLS